MCRQGASAIQTGVLETTEDASLRAYAAWVPILPDDGLEAANENRALVPDARASHFWDARRELPETFARVLGLPEGWPAWDVYLIYDAGASWGDEPPRPLYWEHQLGELEIAPRLDAERFAAQVRAALRRRG